MKLLAVALTLTLVGPPPAYEKATKEQLWDRIVRCDGDVRKLESNVDRLENKLASRTSTVVERLVVPPAPVMERSDKGAGLGVGGTLLAVGASFLAGMVTAGILMLVLLKDSTSVVIAM